MDLFFELDFHFVFLNVSVNFPKFGRLVVFNPFHCNILYFPLPIQFMLCRLGYLNLPTTWRLGGGGGGGGVRLHTPLATLLGAGSYIFQCYVSEAKTVAHKYSSFEIDSLNSKRHSTIATCHLTGKLREAFLFWLRNSFGIFLISFANLKNYLQTLEGICNVPIGCCNIPNFILNFPNFLF
jgi:hypothetical protein